MENAGIIDGDMVIVRQQDGARNGEIVAAMIGDEATVKRFERRKDRITLYPENPDFKPIVVRKDQGEFHIIGVVVGLLRNYR